MCSEENPSKADLVAAFRKLRSIHSNKTQFFRQHGCTTTDSQQKYRSRAANLYREKLHSAAVAAMRLHGTKIHIDQHEQMSPTPTGNEADFFDDLTSMEPMHHVPSNPQMSNEAYMLPHDDAPGPKVEGLDEGLTMASDQPIKKSNLGAKKPAGKKGKLGAQKVTANFNDIEKQAEILDQERDQAAKMAFDIKTKAKEDDGVNKLSSRLMVQDLGKEMEKEEKRMEKLDPKKKDQMERLGMGFQPKSSSGVAHSLTSNIQTIKQEGVRTKNVAKAKDPFEDSWTILNKEPIKDEDDFFDAVEPDSTSWETNNESTNKYSSSRVSEPVSRPAYSSNEDAQKKFGNAKSISSDMYFGNQQDPDFETRAALNRFGGASSIGSADLFGGGNNNTSQYQSHVPEMTDVKDSIKHGVSKVAGKLSNLSSSVQGYIGDYYGY